MLVLRVSRRRVIGYLLVSATVLIVAWLVVFVVANEEMYRIKPFLALGCLVVVFRTCRLLLWRPVVLRIDHEGLIVNTPAVRLFWEEVSDVLRCQGRTPTQSYIGILVKDRAQVIARLGVVHRWWLRIAYLPHITPFQVPLSWVDESADIITKSIRDRWRDGAVENGSAIARHDEDVTLPDRRPKPGGCSGGGENSGREFNVSRQPFVILFIFSLVTMSFLLVFLTLLPRSSPYVTRAWIIPLLAQAWLIETSCRMLIRRPVMLRVDSSGIVVGERSVRIYWGELRSVRTSIHRLWRFRELVFEPSDLENVVARMGYPQAIRTRVWAVAGRSPFRVCVNLLDAPTEDVLSTLLMYHEITEES